MADQGKMTENPLMYDVYCGAGGATKGYQRLGFYVIGIDVNPQRRYCGDEFIQMDAMEFFARLLSGEYPSPAAIHTSPPCQAFSLAAQQWRNNGKEYPDMVSETRDALKATGKPYIIENVPGAPLINPTVLNGAFFGMNLRRTRWFETSFDIPFFLLPKEGPSRFRMGRKPSQDDPVVPVGHFSGVERAREVMEIDWMTQNELAQAIPPAYTEFIGKHLLATITDRERR